MIDWENARQGYGYPAEWLMRFHSHGVRVSDVPVYAIYLKEEKQTQIKVGKFLFYMMGVMVKGGISRIYREYISGNNGHNGHNGHKISDKKDGEKPSYN